MWMDRFAHSYIELDFYICILAGLAGLLVTLLTFGGALFGPVTSRLERWGTFAVIGGGELWSLYRIFSLWYYHFPNVPREVVVLDAVRTATYLFVLFVWWNVYKRERVDHPPRL